MLTLITTYLMKPMNDASTYATYFPSLHPQPTGHFRPTPKLLMYNSSRTYSINKSYDHSVDAALILT